MIVAGGMMTQMMSPLAPGYHCSVPIHSSLL